jgi:hypothetical protein
MKVKVTSAKSRKEILKEEDEIIKRNILDLLKKSLDFIKIFAGKCICQGKEFFSTF